LEAALDTDIRSSTLATKLANGNRGSGVATSVEAGHQLALRGNWSIRRISPRGQLGPRPTWARAYRFRDDFRTISVDQLDCCQRQESSVMGSIERGFAAIQAGSGTVRPFS